MPCQIADAAMADINATPSRAGRRHLHDERQHGHEAARQLEVGTVHVNETSSSRVDVMPCGGVKDSGFGREGRNAIHEMTDERLVTWSLY